MPVCQDLRNLVHAVDPITGAVFNYWYSHGPYPPVQPLLVISTSHVAPCSCIVCVNIVYNFVQFVTVYDRVLSSFKCGIEYHAPTDCDVIKKWMTKCADDSETANYISANTKDVSRKLCLGPVFTNLFRFRIKIRLKFQNE